MYADEAMGMQSKSVIVKEFETHSRTITFIVTKNIDMRIGAVVVWI